MMKFSKTVNANKTIIFDSLSMLSVYNTERDLGRFIYYFSNKTRLNDDSCIFFAVKDAIEENVLVTAQQLCDKYYDYSNIFVESIEAVK